MTTTTLFGYLLATADISYLVFVFSLLYRGFHPRGEATISADYLGSLQADGAMAQAPSNIGTPAWSETRRRA